ncbi:hypothetical protein EMGBS15_18460 [Filimonas sp.]|nr:hypothetical protein EMGBS15_18460 [Filimonas sp.]
MHTLKHLKEEELFVLIRKNDELAIAELLQRNKSKLFTAIYLLVKDRYTAEDLFRTYALK